MKNILAALVLFYSTSLIAGGGEGKVCGTNKLKTGAAANLEKVCLSFTVGDKRGLRVDYFFSNNEKKTSYYFRDEETTNIVKQGDGLSVITATFKRMYSPQAPLSLTLRITEAPDTAKVFRPYFIDNVTGGEVPFNLADITFAPPYSFSFSDLYKKPVN